MQWNWRLERRPVEYVDITMHEIYSRHAGQEFKFAYSTKGEEFLNKAFLDSKIAGPYGPSLFSLGCFSPFHRRTLKKKKPKKEREFERMFLSSSPSQLSFRRI